MPEYIVPQSKTDGAVWTLVIAFVKKWKSLIRVHILSQQPLTANLPWVCVSL